MKIIAAILAILILVMPVQPLFAGMSCLVVKIEKEKKCCSKKKSGCKMEDKKRHENRSDKACNKKCCPLECCSNCYFTGISKPIFDIPYVLLKKVDFQLRNENTLANYIADFWHPPNVA